MATISRIRLFMGRNGVGIPIGAPNPQTLDRDGFYWSVRKLGQMSRVTTGRQTIVSMTISCDNPDCLRILNSKH